MVSEPKRHEEVFQALSKCSARQIVLSILSYLLLASDYMWMQVIGAPGLQVQFPVWIDATCGCLKKPTPIATEKRKDALRAVVDALED
jgi:hypothetical protein